MSSLCSFNVCKWKNRSEVVVNKAILTHQGYNLLPPPPMFVDSRSGYYTYSVIEGKAVITEVTQKRFLDPVWHYVCATNEDQEDVLKIIARNKVLKNTVKHNISDARSSRMEATSDEFFVSY